MIRRNLMMFVYPRSAGQKWRRSVEHIKARWSQFDGRKTVAVAIDQTTDTPDEVAEAFCDDSIQFHVCCNSGLQEVQPFGQLLESVQHEPGITLYAHSKGCTHIENQSSHLWCDAMASACLDYPQMVDFMLERKSIVGPFRSMQRIGHSASPWHFAGTWWWVRNADLFSRNWGDFEQVFWGTESYPGRHFAKHESACLFFDNAHTAHLYAPDWWRVHIGPAFRTWRERLAECGVRPLAANPPNHPLFTEATS
jgi:hypothetical protein